MKTAWKHGVRREIEISREVLRRLCRLSRPGSCRYNVSPSCDLARIPSPSPPPPNLFIRCSNSRIDDSHVASQSKFPPTLEHFPLLQRFFLLRDFRIERVRIGSKPYRNAIRRTLLRNIRISRNRKRTGKKKTKGKAKFLEIFTFRYFSVGGVVILSILNFP